MQNAIGKEVKKMPDYDGRGPLGMGPGTGKGYGPCGLGLGWRRRYGMGRGMGRYFGQWSYPQNRKDIQKALLEYQNALEEELEDVKKEVKELIKDE